MWRTDSFEKTLMLGKIEGGGEGAMEMRRLDAITDSMDMSLSKLQEFTGDQKSPGFSVHGISEARKLEHVAISFSRGSSRPRDQNCVS